MSGFNRRSNRAGIKSRNEATKWALKIQRKSALVFGCVDSGIRLGQMLHMNSKEPHNGLVRLPEGVVDELISSGNVQINGVVCMDPERVIRAGEFIAVFPNEKLHLFEDGQGRRALRLKG